MCSQLGLSMLKKKKLLRYELNYLYKMESKTNTFVRMKIGKVSCFLVSCFNHIIEL